MLLKCCYAVSELYDGIFSLNSIFHATKSRFSATYIVKAPIAWKGVSILDDNSIVKLYLQRNENAIRETEIKYGSYLAKIAQNILGNREDSGEIVNDTYMAAWKTIPPQRPSCLSAYLAKITRCLAVSAFRKSTSQKRQPSEYILSLSELEECIPGETTAEQEVDARLLGEAINSFLRMLPDEARNLFICRYFFMDSIRECAARFNISESKVKSMLHRTRIKLKACLEEEGYL